MTDHISQTTPTNQTTPTSQTDRSDQPGQTGTASLTGPNGLIAALSAATRQRRDELLAACDQLAEAESSALIAFTCYLAVLSQDLPAANRLQSEARAAETGNDRGPVRDLSYAYEDVLLRHVGLIKRLYWHHPELSVGDLMELTLLGPDQLRRLVGTRRRWVVCSGCGREEERVQRSRSDRRWRTPDRCATCRDHDAVLDDLRRDDRRDGQRPGPAALHLGAHLGAVLAWLYERLPDAGCDGTFHWTVRWAQDQRLDPSAVVEASLRDMACRCDCELLDGVDHTWPGLTEPPDPWFDDAVTDR